MHLHLHSDLDKVLTGKSVFCYNTYVKAVFILTTEFHIAYLVSCERWIIFYFSYIQFMFVYFCVHELSNKNVLISPQTGII